MAEADRAFNTAEAFLCIGYGFNDEHIQEYLVRQLRHRGKPFVLVAKSLTDRARQAIDKIAAETRYCVLTEAQDTKGQPIEGKSRIATRDNPAGIDVEGPVALARTRDMLRQLQEKSPELPA
jgi:hypothetical protein